jgi:hypothetical protein
MLLVWILPTGTSAVEWLGSRENGKAKTIEVAFAFPRTGTIMHSEAIDWMISLKAPAAM